MNCRRVSMSGLQEAAAGESRCFSSSGIACPSIPSTCWHAHSQFANIDVLSPHLASGLFACTGREKFHEGSPEWTTLASITCPSTSARACHDVRWPACWQCLVWHFPPSPGPSARRSASHRSVNVGNAAVTCGPTRRTAARVAGPVELVKRAPEVRASCRAQPGRRPARGRVSRPSVAARVPSVPVMTNAHKGSAWTAPALC